MSHEGQLLVLEIDVVDGRSRIRKIMNVKTRSPNARSTKYIFSMHIEDPQIRSRATQEHGLKVSSAAGCQIIRVAIVVR